MGQPQEDERRLESGLIASDGKLKCARCSRSFKRPEHLKRHERSHEGLRRFSCPICDKKFARSDILARHSSIHKQPQTAGPNSSKDGEHSRRRACTECARAREKCTRALPCMRCSGRSLECVYPERQARHTGKSPEAFEEQMSYSAPFENSTLGRGNVEANHDATPDVPCFDAPQGDGNSPLTSDQLVGDAFMADSYNALRSSRFQAPDSANAHDLASLDLREPRPSTPQFYRNDVPVPVTENFMYAPSVYDATLGFAMNWLPANDAIDVDFSSILGLGLSPNTMQPYNEPAGVRPRLPLQVSNEIYGEASRPPAIASPAEVVSTLSNTSHRSLPLPPRVAKGGLYATSSNGARVPCTVRSQRVDPSLRIHNCQSLSPISNGPSWASCEEDFLSFPDLSHVSVDNPEYHDQTRSIQTALYETMRNCFHRLCLASNPVHRPFESVHFPSIQHLNFFLGLYFDQFAGSLPIIHEPTFDVNRYWPLTLAMTAIGCQYTQTHEFWSYVAPVHEFLRRVLITEQENRIGFGDDDTPFIQALLLSQVGMLYCGSSHLQALAKRRHGELVSLVKLNGLMSIIGDHNRDSSWDTQDHRRWVGWLAAETKRRLAYSIVLLDCMMSYHFRLDANLLLEMAQSDLPHDGLWFATPGPGWDELYEKTERNPSLFTAVQHLFTDKQVKGDLGEFGRIILLHGVYREVFQVKDYITRPLSSWIPSAEPLHNANEGGNKHTDRNKGKWLADVSIFSSWRNAAMDCVDTLHWGANATIALLSGAEHSTVMHLHLARVVLFAPYDQILTLALSVAFSRNPEYAGRQTPTRDEAIAAEHEVLQWAQRDGSKARLAALHSGCFYWHIRRYSTMAFYEPVSVFLASLTLWAYSYYTSRVTAQRRQSSRDDEESRSGSLSRQASPEVQGTCHSHAGASPSTSRASHSRHPHASPRPSTYTPDRDPTFIRLDRPNDDEMVQLFVRSANMRAHIAGVGDVCAAEGPVRILREARKILGTVSMAWGRTREYHDILEAMEQATMTRANDERVGLQAMA